MVHHLGHQQISRGKDPDAGVRHHRLRNIDQGIITGCEIIIRRLTPCLKNLWMLWNCPAHVVGTISRIIKIRHQDIAPSHGKNSWVTLGRLPTPITLIHGVMPISRSRHCFWMLIDYQNRLIGLLQIMLQHVPYLVAYFQRQAFGSFIQNHETRIRHQHSPDGHHLLFNTK